MKAIILGASGQDGYYLTKILQREGVTVYPFSRKECDVGVQGYVCHQIAQIKPDFVFNLAATSTTAHEAVWANQKAIVDGSLNILEAVKTYSPATKVWLAGSILQLSQYGFGKIIKEQSNDSIYAAQRNASLAYARYYLRLGLDVYFGYLSYHDSPLRSPSHLAKRIANEVKKVASGESPFIVIKNPLDEKEWNFAGDMMEAVWAQVNSKEYEAVLGSGITASVHQYAKECFKAKEVRIDNAIHQEFTREGTLRSFTDDKRFQHHFKTSLSDLAKMMVGPV